MLGAAMSLGETLENGRLQGQIRPGAALALAGAPFLLAGLPSMTAGTTRMRRALRMEGIFVPAIPVIGAWSLLAELSPFPSAHSSLRSTVSSSRSLEECSLVASTACRSRSTR